MWPRRAPGSVLPFDAFAIAQNSGGERTPNAIEVRHERRQIRLPQRCRDVPSEIPGLVTFRRIDPSVRSWLDCEAFGDTQLFAKKLDELTYDFLASCSFNCRVKSNYHGWGVQYLYHHTYLAEWQRIHERLTHFLDQHTVYLDEDGTNAVAGER
jgi:hypothetical protein